MFRSSSETEGYFRDVFDFTVSHICHCVFLPEEFYQTIRLSLFGYRILTWNNRFYSILMVYLIELNYGVLSSKKLLLFLSPQEYLFHLSSGHPHLSPQTSHTSTNFSSCVLTCSCSMQPQGGTIQCFSGH